MKSSLSVNILRSWTYITSVAPTSALTWPGPSVYWFVRIPWLGPDQGSITLREGELPRFCSSGRHWAIVTGDNTQGLTNIRAPPPSCDQHITQHYTISTTEHWGDNAVSINSQCPDLSDLREEEHGLHPAPPPLSHSREADVYPASKEEDGLRKDGDLHSLQISSKVCYLWRPNIKCPGMKNSKF